MSFDARPVRHAYEAIADEYANTFADEITANDFDRAVIDGAVADFGDHSVVADIGCGPGQVAAYLKGRGRWAVGLDLTPAMLAIARQRNRTLSLAGGDVFALPLRDSAVDGVVAWFSLHNMPRASLPAALSELRRAVRPGGVLLLATHRGRGEDTVRQVWNGAEETVPITYYEPDELAHLIAQFGFDARSVRRRAPLSHEHQAEKLYITAARD